MKMGYYAEKTMIQCMGHVYEFLTALLQRKVFPRVILLRAY